MTEAYAGGGGRLDESEILFELDGPFGFVVIRRILLRILFLKKRAIFAPVAVEYDGGGVYFGGGSSDRPVVDRSRRPDSDAALPNRNRVLGRYNCCMR